VRLVWHYLRQGVVRVSQRDPQQLLALESETLGLVDRIAREREYAPVPGRLCAWCEYRDGCPASPHYRTELPGYGVSLPPPAIARNARRRPVVSSAQLSLPFA